MRADVVWGWLRRVGLFAITVVVVEYVVLPRVLSARVDLHLFLDASPLLLGLAVVLEAWSLLCYTALTRVVLPPAVCPRFFDQLRIDLTGLGVSHIVPGGGATAAALRYRLMVGSGVPPEDAASTAAVQSVVVAIGLAGTFVGGLTLMGPGLTSHPGYTVSGLVAVCALAAVAVGEHRIRVGGTSHPAGALLRRISRRRPSGGGWARRWRRPIELFLQTIATTAQRVSVLTRDPEARTRVFTYAVCNWVFDATCLWVCLRGYGVSLDPGALLTAYGAANLLALLPVTPGGLGIVEGVLIPSLTGLGGATLGAVTLGVLTWRLLEFWIPIPVSGITYVSLRVRATGGGTADGPWSSQPMTLDDPTR